LHGPKRWTFAVDCTLPVSCSHFPWLAIWYWSGVRCCLSWVWVPPLTYTWLQFIIAYRPYAIPPCAYRSDANGCQNSVLGHFQFSDTTSRDEPPSGAISFKDGHSCIVYGSSETLQPVALIVARRAPPLLQTPEAIG